MADTLVKKPKLIVGTQSQVEAEMGANDIGFATDIEFYTAKQIDELLSKAGGASLPILMPVWSDHLLNDMSWLRADTFSWHSGGVYVAAYEHLAEELPEIQTLYSWQNDKAKVLYTYSATPKAGAPVVDANGEQKDTVVSLSGNTLTTTGSYSSSEWYRYTADIHLDGAQTDTIGEITITYYEADDGHKICLPDQESNIVALYEKTGVAWYYILDTENKQFKLPRTKFGFTGLRDSVGGYVEPGLPNIEGDSGIITTTGVPTGAFSRDGAKAKTWNTDSSNTYAGTTFDASRSNSIYGASDTVQPAATQMYLYFYVGNFEQSAVEQTAGITAETLNGKLDLDVGNVPKTTKETIVGWGMPDYTAGVSISGTTFTAPCDCFIAFYVGASVQNGGGGSINVDGVVIDSLSTTSCTVAGFKHAWVAKGSVVELARGAGGNTANYYPLKGAI